MTIRRLFLSALAATTALAACTKHAHHDHHAASITSVGPAKSATTREAAAVPAASHRTSSDGYPELDAQADGLPGFPLQGQHLAAIELPGEPPHGYALYDVDDFLFDCDKFMNWTQDASKNHTSSGGTVNPKKWLKVAPGTYEYALGSPAPAGEDSDPNLYAGRNIRFVFFDDGWTLDLRGVTFSIPVTPKNSNLRPWDAIYVNQSPNFTILGGTIWFDQGEIYTYATVTSLDESTGAAKIILDKGYNSSAWATDLVNARNVGCLDVSGWPKTVKDGQCNFWYMSNYAFDASTKTATATFDVSRSGMKQGMVLVRDNGFNTAWAVSSETEGGLVVNGLTTNGDFIQIGNNDGGASVIYENCTLVNPPPRPGMGPRYGGPAIQWGHIGATYNGPSTPPLQFRNSTFQMYGGSEDLKPLPG